MISDNDQHQNREIIFFLLRLWFGYTMMGNGRFIFDRSNEDFFLGWFGNDLHFPFPVLMYYLAKGSEFFGGLLIFLGFATKIAGSFVAFVMMVATLTANRHHLYSGDGSITISFFLMAVMFIYYGAGKWSVDRIISKNTRQRFPELPLIVVRFWFSSLLLYTGLQFGGKDALYVIFAWFSDKAGLSSNIWLTGLAKGFEIVCGLSILSGFFTRPIMGTMTIIMFAISLIAYLGIIDVGNANQAYVHIFFWFSLLLLYFFPANAQAWQISLPLRKYFVQSKK
ncbi:MAG TPA: DoxX family protein [Puia sp.]|nr:DoxX family protein [Puia sp.]